MGDAMQSSGYQRKNYWALDVAKVICAIFLVSAHFASEWAKFPTLIDYLFSVYIIAVPFFFCCSGFLFFTKINALETKEEKKKYFISYQKRIWIIYGVWSAVYFPFIIASWVRNNILTWGQFLKWLHMAVVFQTYATIWFLPALAVGIALTYLLVTKVKKTWGCVVICAVLYLIGSFGYSYDFLFRGTFIGRIYEGYVLAFKTTRNGLFNAVPFLYMGYTFTRKSVMAKKENFIKNGGIVVACFLVVVAESFFLKLQFNISGMDFIFALVPFTYFFMKALLSLDLRERKIYMWCRKISLLMFVTQRLFLSALPSVMKGVFAFLYANNYLGLCIVLLLTMGFSVCMIALSKKIKILKWIM